MTPPPDSEYRDRKTGLVLFGILEIAIGFLCALAIPLMMLSRFVASRRPDASPAPPVLPVVVMYGFMAVAFIWLGIGSIQARRWARAILLCLSGVALCVGVFGCAWLAMIMPRIFEAMAQNGRQALQPGALLVAKIIMSCVILVVYIAIPGALFLFYRSPNVKRTCEVRDPVERWTDRCPLPVLAFSLLTGFGGVIVLGLLGIGVFPVFGFMVSGSAGVLLVLFLAGLLLYLARGLYRLRDSAWWMALGLLVVSTVSNIVTFSGSNLSDIYLKMGFDQRTAAVSGQLFEQPAFKWMFPLSVLPWIIWLLCIRRYFTNQEPPPLLSDSGPTQNF